MLLLISNSSKQSDLYRATILHHRRPLCFNRYCLSNPISLLTRVRTSAGRP